MEAAKTTKKAYLSVIGAIGISTLAYITPNSYYQAIIENEFIKELKDKLSLYNKTAPEDRLYVQLDKPMYEPGDDIWFAAYIRDGITLKASDKSEIVYAELINPKGGIEKKIDLIARNGKAAGDLSIDKDAAGGLYKLKVYTTWMKNFGEDNAFVKDIQVQEVILPTLKMKLDFERKAFGAGDEVIAKLSLQTNENKPLANHKLKYVANLNGQKLIDLTETTDEEGLNYIRFTLPKDLKTNDGLLNVMIDYNGSTESISRSIPIVLNKIQLSLLPEGGDLVNGLENTVALKSLNEFTKPAAIEGEVYSEKGSKIATLNSFHNGMGSFKLHPQNGETYYVKITMPEGIEQRFPLPQALDRGYAMHVENKLSGELKVQLHSTETEELSLVAQVRGKIYYSTVIDAKKGVNDVVFSTEKFPIGVAQITVFDSKGIARCERLAFVNKDKQMKISIETEKEKYLPREKVKMTITVKDERGMPMPANLSMAVVNDQFLSFADDRSGNILSELLLQQDIHEKVEEPAFYFDPKEPKANEALDHLLMTSGWRRFTWEQIIDEDLPNITFTGEKAIVSGIVYNSETGKPMPNVEVKATDGSLITTNSEGQFTFKKLDLYDNITLNFSHQGYYHQSQYVQSYGQNMNVWLYKEYPHHHYSRSKSQKSSATMDMVVAESASGAGMRNEMLPMAAPVKKALAPADNKAIASKEALKKDQKDVSEKKELKNNKDENAKIASNVADRRFGKAAIAEDMEEEILPHNPSPKK